MLRSALDACGNLGDELVTFEIKALLMLATIGPNPPESQSLRAEIEDFLRRRPIPAIRELCEAAAKREQLLEQEHFFILSDLTPATLQQARHEMMKWLWSRALHKAEGNVSKAGELLAITANHVRKFKKVIAAGSGSQAALLPPSP